MLTLILSTTSQGTSLPCGHRIVAVILHALKTVWIGSSTAEHPPMALQNAPHPSQCMRGFSSAFFLDVTGHRIHPSPPGNISSQENGKVRGRGWGDVHPSRMSRIRAKLRVKFTPPHVASPSVQPIPRLEWHVWNRAMTHGVYHCSCDSGDRSFAPRPSGVTKSRFRSLPSPA